MGNAMCVSGCGIVPKCACLSSGESVPRFKIVQQAHNQRVHVETFVRDILPRKDNIREQFLARYLSENEDLLTVLEGFGWNGKEEAFADKEFQAETTEFFDNLWQSFSTYSASPDPLNAELKKLGRFLRRVKGFHKRHILNIEQPFMASVTDAYLMRLTPEVQVAVFNCLIESLESLVSIYKFYECACLLALPSTS